MFHLLGFLFIIVIVVLVIGLSIVGTVLRAVFGFGRRRPSSTTTSGRQSYQTQEERDHTSEKNNNEEIIRENASGKHKKIFTKDEGEYVDFEEVKE